MYQFLTTRVLPLDEIKQSDIFIMDTFEALTDEKWEDHIDIANEAFENGRDYNLNSFSYTPFINIIDDSICNIPEIHSALLKDKDIAQKFISSLEDKMPKRTVRALKLALDETTKESEKNKNMWEDIKSLAKLKRRGEFERQLRDEFGERYCTQVSTIASLLTKENIDNFEAYLTFSKKSAEDILTPIILRDEHLPDTTTGFHLKDVIVEKGEVITNHINNLNDKDKTAMAKAMFNNGTIDYEQDDYEMER